MVKSKRCDPATVSISPNHHASFSRPPRSDLSSIMKRVRRASSPSNERPNGSASPSSLPALSLSILGVEPLDEFIKEVADFVHHMIMTRGQEIPNAKVEVEAKIGVLRERSSGQRLSLPVLVETSTSFVSLLCQEA